MRAKSSSPEVIVAVVYLAGQNRLKGIKKPRWAAPDAVIVGLTKDEEDCYLRTRS